MTIYLVLGLLTLGDILLLVCLAREKRAHKRTSDALRWWRRYQEMNHEPR